MPVGLTLGIAGPGRPEDSGFKTARDTRRSTRFVATNASPDG